MKKINKLIDKLVDEIKYDKNVLRYVYNDQEEFIPSKTPIYYSGPYWNDIELKEGVKAFLTGKWLSSGENVHKFEIAFSKKFNAGNSVMVNSGSSANLVMVAALKKVFDWKNNDEIIVSPVGFPTTIAPIVQNGLRPIFIDIEWDTLNFDVTKIKESITEYTKAIFISPVLGNPPDFTLLTKIKEEYGIELILDNCDSLGSTWNGKYLNEYSIASSCSFYPAHHITTGEGGMVSSKSKEIIDVARSFSWWGRDCYCIGSANLLACGTCGNRFDNWLDSYNGKIDHKYVFSNMGYNLKPMDMQGALGLVQLEKFDEIHKKRKNSFIKISEIINNHLDNYTSVISLDEASVSWFGVPIIAKKSGGSKQKLVDYLEENKIQTRPYFAGNILLHPAYKHLGKLDDFPNSNQVLDKVFFIGASPHYHDKIFSYIESVISGFDS